MTIEVYPVKYEGYDESGEPMFRLEAFDEGGAKVTIETFVNSSVWLDLSSAIHKALVDMKLQEG